MTSSHDRRDRGASAVEYALLLSLFVLGTLGALRALAGGMSDQFQRQSDHVASGPVVTARSGDDGGGGGGSSPPPAHASTTTTAPAPTSTTTVAPTTTSTTEVVEVSGEQVSGDDDGDGRDDDEADDGDGRDDDEADDGDGRDDDEADDGDGRDDDEADDGDGRGDEGGDAGTTAWLTSSASRQGSSWTASATIRVNGTDGEPLRGSAGVKVRVRQQYVAWDGRTGEEVWTTQANLDEGRATFTDRGRAIGGVGQYSVVAMVYEVIGVEYWWPSNPDIRWDGDRPTVRVESPDPPVEPEPTTVAVAQRSAAGRLSSNGKKWSAETSFVVTDQHGTPVDRARVQVTETRHVLKPNGSTQLQVSTKTDWADERGLVEFERNGLTAEGNNTVLRVTYEITRVDKLDDGVSWAADGAEFTVVNPHCSSGGCAR